MAIKSLKTRADDSPQPGAGNFPVREVLSSPEPGCFRYDDRHRSLILTQLDGTTEGYPLTWLYRWRWHKGPAHEVLALTLTEHEVTIRGKNLEYILEHLQSNHGLHLRVKDDRYLSLEGKGSVQISAIMIEPNAQPPTELK